MNVIQRFFKMAEAELSAAVDGIEDPETMVEQVLRDREDEIREARSQVQAILATQLEYRDLASKERDAHSDWEAKATIALQKGDEDLARQAVEQGLKHRDRAVDYENRDKALEEDLASARTHVKRMEVDFEELKAHKAQIVARLDVAEFRREGGESLLEYEMNETDNLINRLTSKVERNVHEANAAEQLADEEAREAKLKQAIDDLKVPTADSPSVQAKLAALKQKLGK